MYVRLTFLGPPVGSGDHKQASTDWTPVFLLTRALRHIGTIPPHPERPRAERLETLCFVATRRVGTAAIAAVVALLHCNLDLRNLLFALPFVHATRVTYRHAAQR